MRTRTTRQSRVSGRPGQEVERVLRRPEVGVSGRRLGMREVNERRRLVTDGGRALRLREGVGRAPERP